MNAPAPFNRNGNGEHRPAAHSKTADTPSASAKTHVADGRAPLLSRRQLLYGAVGIGAVAAVGVGVASFSSSGAPDDSVRHLTVPTNAVTTLSEFEALEEYEDKVQVIDDLELPYGSLVWMNDDSVAACLLPTESGSPLTQVAVLHLSSASATTVLEKAIGFEEHYDVYDVRATSEGLIWTEANVLEGSWRIYAAQLSGETIGSPILLDEGGSTYETPTIAAVGNRVFWQVLPQNPNPDKLPSKLMAASFGQESGDCIYESVRRMGTPIYAGEDSVTIAPRIDSPTVYYQLTNIQASTGTVADQVTLPAAMTPLEAGYGETGFMFSFPDIYDFDSGIANLGTYVPMTDPRGDYSEATKWFGFARTPTAPPCWCKGTLIVKSTRAICGVNLDAGTYYAIDVDDGADSYGEYLATTGTHDVFVTYTNIDHKPVEGDATHACRVKIWTTLS